jgi:hypothetical protein
MAIPIIYLIAAAAGAVMLSEGNSKELKSSTVVKPIIPKSTPGILNLALAGVPVERPSGPLPASALRAWNAPRKGKRKKRSSYGKDNDIKKRASWFRFATYSSNFAKKRELIRFYSDPPGALFLRSKNQHHNIAWMARCRPDWYPGYKKAARRNCRVDPLKLWLSPKADWDTFKGIFSDSVEAIPQIIEGAGVIAGGVTSGGASLSQDPQGQAEALIDSIKSSLKPIGNTGKSVSKRLDAADVVVSNLMRAYIQQMKEANPWAILKNDQGNSTFNVGANYHPKPKTYEDLFDRSWVGKKGAARPLLWNP